MNIIDRLLIFIDNKGITPNKFGQMIEVSNAYLSKQKKNNANIGSQIIEKIVRIYPDINLDWLITGEGKMLKETTQHSPDLVEHLKTENKALLARLEELNREIGRLQNK